MNPGFIRSIALSTTFLAMFVAHAQAATQTYQNGNSANTWNTSDFNWDAGVKWVAGNDAIFAGTGESVAVGTVSVGNITFNSVNYILIGGDITLSGATPTIAANVNVTIQSVLAGSNGLIKAGGGNLILSGANTYSGDTTVNAGTLTVNHAFFADSSTVRVATGAVLNLNTGTIDTVASLVLGGVIVPPGTYDASDPTYGGFFTGNGSLLVEGTAYDAWTAAKNLSGADAQPSSDPDHDGINNAVEFVIGGEPNPANPNANSCALMPTISLTTADLVFTFRRTELAAGYDPLVEYSGNLTGWTEAEGGVDGVVIHETPGAFGAGVDQVDISIPKTLAVNSKLFARLKVIAP